jgi:hypothetical protein
MALPSPFTYIKKNVVNHNMGNGCDISQFFVEDSCFDCHPNCVTMLAYRNCAQYGGGECAYTQSGLLKKCHIDKVGSNLHFVNINCLKFMYYISVLERWPRCKNLCIKLLCGLPQCMGLAKVEDINFCEMGSCIMFTNCQRCYTLQRPYCVRIHQGMQWTM